MRSLVIFYSKSGHTLTVADTIKKSLGSHVQEITDYTTQRSLLDYMFPSLIDSASIDHIKLDVSYYETIFIGTPVWIGSFTPAIKKIIDSIDFKNRNVVLFSTSNGIGQKIAMKRLAKLVKKHNGNVIGGFSIPSIDNKERIIDYTQTALNNLNLV